MRTAAIALEGVLRKPLDVEAQDFAATSLFNSLSQGFRLVVLGTSNPTADEHFLRVNGLRHHVLIEPVRAVDGKGVAHQIRRQVARLRRQGFLFDFVVVPDPEAAKGLYIDGVPVLLYLHPKYSAKDQRPDFEPGLTPWNDIVAEVEFQREARAEQEQQA